MNCSTAQRLFSAERDGTLSIDQQAGLESHVVGCAQCRQARAGIAASIKSWRASTAGAHLPNVERAWQDIRRETRSTASSAGSRNSFGVLRWAVPIGAAAALALTAVWSPRWQSKAVAAQVAQLETARADFVEVPSDASSMVYVDDQSGWLVVWSVSDAQPSGG